MSRQANRILIIQLADIGDLVLSTPALDALREARPDALIALLTTAHSSLIVKHTGLVDDIITFDKHIFDSPKALLKPHYLRKAFALARTLRRGKYETIVFLHHFTTRFGTLKFAALAWCAGSKHRIGLQNGNGFFLTDSIPDNGFGAKHQAQYWLDLVRLLGADNEARQAKINTASGANVPSVYRDNVGRSGKRIIIHAGSGGYSLARRWDATSFAAVADKLHHEHGVQIVLVGTADDNSAQVKALMQHEPCDLIGKTTLPELAGVIADADLFIGADSGVMHIAAAVGTPVVAIFGPSNAGAWRPWTPHGKSVVIRSAPECSPCSYVRHSVGLRDGCPARTCMRMVTVQQVVKAANSVLRENAVGAWRHAMPSQQESDNRLRILGLPVDAITYDQWLENIGAWINKHDRAHHVCTINPEFAMIAQHDVNFHNILSRADLCVPDGVGMLWAAKRLGHHLPQRVTGSDGVPIIAECAAHEGWRLYFLGAAPGVAAKAADRLREKHPGLQIVGTYSGSPDPDEEDTLVEMVNKSQVDILFVAFGAPVQDKWIARNLPRLQVSMAMGVGGSFDFIAGIVPRAPMWMQRMGIEWVFRLMRQPWRAKRMLRLPRFVFAVWRQTLTKSHTRD